MSWIPQLGSQPTADGNLDLWLVESVGVKPVNRTNDIFINRKVDPVQFKPVLVKGQLY